MLKNKQAGGAPRQIGDLVKVDEASARYLVAVGSAEPEGKPASEAPLAASEVPVETISRAVPDGPRPHRRKR